MTVGELIEILKTFDPELDVTICGDDIVDAYINYDDIDEDEAYVVLEAYTEF